MSLKKPESDEYASYYAGYIQDLPDENIVSYLESQVQEFESVLKDLPAEKASFRYAPGKWSVKEVLGHINDTERIMSYRLLRIARGDTTELAGFEENDYVRNAGSEQLTVTELLNEFIAVRSATVALVKPLTHEAWLRVGSANKTRVSARAVLYIIAGHAAHHIKLIRERYLLNSAE